MTFKNFLNERKPQSHIILKYISKGDIPISPKAWEDITGKYTKHYCFMALEPYRIRSVIEREHKRNQMSTFTDWSGDNIFWGAEYLDWRDNGTVVAVLNGRTSMKTKNDMWTEFDKIGRRWIDVSMHRDSNNMGDILIDMQKEIIKKFSKTIEAYIKDKDVRYFFKQGINYLEVLRDFDYGKVSDELNAVKKDYIIMYFDTTKEVLAKYAHKLEDAYKEDTLNSYDEVLCYNYEVVEFLYLAKGLGGHAHNSFLEILKEKSSPYKKYKFNEVKDVKALKTALTKYKKMN